MTAESTTPNDAPGHSRERLKGAALAVIDRDGVLGGVRINEVAEAAGVNRSLVYRHFRSHKGLLREALNWEVERVYPHLRARQEALPFVERRSKAFESLIEHHRAAQLMMMLVLDGDDNVKVSPLADSSIARLKEEVASGELPADSEILGIHAFFVAATLGYATLRVRLAEELGITAEDLDEQVEAARESALEGVRRGVKYQAARR